VSRADTALHAAVASASEELARRRARFEVFARLGESTHLVHTSDGSWLERNTREVGVACRVAQGGRTGFAAAAGAGARAGREAAQAALAGLLPGPDPLPPRRALGTVPITPPARPALRRQDAFARELAAALDGSGLKLVQLRTLGGSSTALLATGEGYLARTEAAGCVAELLLAPPAGPWRHFHFAAREFGEMDPLALANHAREAALLAVRGTIPPRALTDVLLAPAVAAPLVAALAEHVAAGPGGPTTAAPPRVSRAWRLVDERAGPNSLLPLPCDGEGLPSRRIELLGAGRIGERLATWAEAERDGVAPGGAVRPSYRHPPAAGPANLVVVAAAPKSPRQLLAELGDGYYLALPAGAVRLEAGSGRFALRAAAVAIRRGRPAAAHPLVELRGSFRRLLAGLSGLGDDPADFSLSCAVTTPSLLFRRLEIA